VGKKKQFCHFFGLRHLVVPPTGSSLKKLSTGAQLQTFPYPTASDSSAFMGKSGTQSLTFKSMTDRQANKQTKNSTFLAVLVAGEVRASPNLAC